MVGSHAVDRRRNTIPAGPGEYMAEYFGVYRAIVVDNNDPAQRGRVAIRVPSVEDPNGSGNSHQGWAPVSVLTAGKDRRTWYMPEKDDEVLVAFESGDPRRPFVIGALWNGNDKPPTSKDNTGGKDVKKTPSRKAKRSGKLS